MNNQAFFDAIRPAFGGNLSLPQVDGMRALLDAGVALPLHHMANVLANVRRETGGHMSPIKETVMPHHKDKSPSDAEVIRRLDNAFARGQLTWVKTPYWRSGWFGRGQIQITHEDKYRKFGITKKDDALRLDKSAHIAVVGMRDGIFTGRSLSDYTFPDDLDNPPRSNPRRIVNGQDGSDAEVARFHRQFAAALLAAGWGIDTPAEPAGDNIFRDDFMPEPSAPTPAPRQQAVPTLRIGSKGEAVRAWQQRLRDLRYFSGKIDGDFGSRTHGATMEFQADHGLVQDGIVGPQTRAAEANAVPRALRDVSKEEVAAESRTIKEAEKGKQRIAVAGVLAGLPTAVSQIEEITEVINQARSLTDLMSGLAPMTLAILGIGAAVFFGFRAFNRIEGYRIEDAQTGANDRI